MLRPYLEDKINHSWVDPRSAESDEDLLYRYKVAWAFAQAAEQILAFLDQMVEQEKGLTAKEKGEVVNKLKESMG